MKLAYIHCHATRPDGTRDTFHTVKCEAKEAPLWWQVQGFSFTTSGYGSRIPTRWMVKFNDRWRRVYCRIYSNSGTCYLNNVNGTINVTIKGDDGMTIKVFEWTGTNKHPIMRPGSVRVVLVNIDQSTAAIDDYVNWDSFALAHNV